MKENKIFIQIASYRDPELLPTIKNCLENAKYPNNLVFSIAWQHSKDDKWDNLDEFLMDTRFKIIDIDYLESNGTCWARNLLQQQYCGEDYTLQIDSHHRFTKDWDETLINELENLRSMGYKKPVLTAYLPSYDPSSDPQSRVQSPWKVNFDRFSPEGVLHLRPSTIDNFKEIDSPIHARFYSGHFCFADGSFCEEVQHDPEFYFHGEEISISVRAYTHGYDLFHPHKVIIWHYYTRKGSSRHWDDSSSWYDKNRHCHYKNRKLFGMEDDDVKIDFGKYGFGNVRTLDDYERFSGVNFKKRGVQQWTLDEKNPPNPIIENEVEYQNSFSIYFKHCIDIGFNDVPYDDYDCWAVAFIDDNGVEICRMDANENEIKTMKSDPDGYCKLWRSFVTVKRPVKWVVWPHSIEHGWVNRLEGNI